MVLSQARGRACAGVLESIYPNDRIAFCGGGGEANPFAPKGDCLWCDRGPGWVADRRRRNRNSGNQPERK